MDTLRIWQHLLELDSPSPDAALLSYRLASRLDQVRGGVAEEAEARLSRAARRLESAGAPEAASANHLLAVLHQQRSDYDGAIFHAVRAAFLYSKARDLGGIHASLRNLSVIHEARGESELARASQAQADRALEELAGRGLAVQMDRGVDSRGESLRLLSSEWTELRSSLTA